MDRECWDGTATYQRDGTSSRGTIRIQRIQGFRNLVTIEGLGQGKVLFERDGSFQGSWALGDQIYDVSGRAESGRTQWTGRFELRSMDGQIHVTGSFQAAKTHD